ncbi:uncharacterized protein LOC142628973 [Castanea sativa]|uniref:uncharacterized protein LOC142628973 n=1 Tax=Castanea sativa TaxID=21020 RepID=UPI003F6496A0
MSLLAWNCRGLGSSLAVRILTDKVKAKDPTLVILAKTKAGVSRMKGIQRKLKYMQGIIIPSDGRSGGIALIWKEGIDIRFKSCSNSHVDVVVHGVLSPDPWRAIGFYAQPDSSKRDISWKDFNEIVHPDEKLGGADRDVGQMEAFRDCLNRCGLCDLGFVGKKFTWCNGCFGAQRT